jgi:RNA polymerase sigma-70 factor (ECF subfamily)
MDSSKIIARLRQGKEAELANLFDELKGNIRGMIQCRLDRRLLARIDASDIFQESYIRASNGLESFLETAKVHPVVWIRQIVKHIVAEMHRRHFRYKRSPEAEIGVGSELPDNLIDQLASSMTSVCTNLARREAVQRVRASMLALAPQDREILEMRHTDGIPMREIASLLELNLETVKKRYQRALHRLVSQTPAVQSGR